MLLTDTRSGKCPRRVYNVGSLVTAAVVPPAGHPITGRVLVICVVTVDCRGTYNVHRWSARRKLIAQFAAAIQHQALSRFRHAAQRCEAQATVL